MLLAQVNSSRTAAATPGDELFRPNRFDIFIPQLIDRFSGVFLPELGAIFSLPHGGIELHDDLVVLICGQPFKESGRLVIAQGVLPRAGTGFAPLLDWLVLEPAQVIGDAFDEPAGIISAAILLGDVHQLVNDSAAIVWMRGEPLSAA